MLTPGKRCGVATKTSPMAEWQPIETAPKNGTKVILIAYDAWSKRWIIWEDSWRTYLDEEHEGWGLATINPTNWTLPPDKPNG